MKEKFLDFILKNKPNFDLLLLFALIINTVFIGLYTYEYQPRGAIYILYAVIPSYLLSISIGLASVLINDKKSNILEFVWILCIFYALIALPLYSVLLSNGKKYLILNLSASLFLLAMMCNWVMFICILVSGLLFGGIMFLITAFYIDGDIMSVPKKKYLVFYIMSYTVVFLALFMRKKERVQEKKMDFMKVFGSAIAHEVNAPLAAMKMMSDVMDTIFSCAQIKQKGDKYQVSLDEMDYEMFENVVRPGFRQSSNDAIQITEMLLSALRDKYTNAKTNITISKVVYDSVEMATHLDPDSNRISVTENQNFEVNCNPKLLKHVIYNLIKNSFKHGGENVNVVIEINDREVVVSDNGNGIPQDKINKIFNTFFTDGNGSGIGLAFASFVLDDINATIGCESEVGEFTKFIIKFD